MQETIDQGESAWVNARTTNTPTAKEFAEWTLLAGDLEDALRRAQLWKELSNTEATNDKDCQLSVSVFRDAVITFASCFDNTLSAFLDPSVVYTATSGGVEYIGWLKDLRNTWIAHRSGPERQCVAAILIDEDTGDFRGLGHLSHRYMGPKPNAGDDLVRVMEIALSHARKEVKDRESQLRQEIQRLGNTERLRLPAANTVIPASKEIHMGRRKFRTIKRSLKRKGQQ